MRSNSTYDHVYTDLGSYNGNPIAVGGYFNHSSKVEVIDGPVNSCIVFWILKSKSLRKGFGFEIQKTKQLLNYIQTHMFSYSMHMNKAG